MRSDWHGLMKIVEIQHIRKNKVIWEKKNLYNLFHTEGEQFMLMATFANDGTVLPTSYYVGLDNRSSPAVDDTMDDIEDEPTDNGYIRQALGIEGGWTIEKINGVYRAIGNIITFQATGGSWGPVNNLFLTDKSDNTGYLLATASLSNELTMEEDDSINMRMSLSLRDESI
jgi:hypothetical protein